MGYTQFIQGKLDQMVNDADKSYNDIEDLFLNNWQNDKLVRPVDMYGGKYQAPLRSVSLNKDAAMPNIIFGQRTDMQAAVIKPLNWVTVDDIKYPIFPPYVKVKDSLGFEPANWHVYRLIGYIDKPERTWQGKLTGRTLYTPIYGLVSKKGYSYKGHTIIEYGLSTQFEFNKENEWDYFEALNNLDALSDMTDEVERTYFEQDKAYMHHIGELPSYSGMNYAIAEQDRIFEYEQDEVDDSVEGVVLEEAEEPLDNTNGTQSKNQYEWDRYSNNGYEVSTAGDTRFSAKVAKFKPGTVIDGVDVGGETIEDVYQKVIKKSDKGMPPSKDSKLYNPNLTTKEQREDFSYEKGYLPLWQEWAKQNPDLIVELAEKAKDKTLTDKFGISHNPTLEDSLVASLDTLIDNFDSMIYNDWNKTRTAQRWFRDNIQRVSINKYIGNKVMDQVNTQLENEPYEEVAELIINIPTDIARDIYNQLGGQNAKNKPFILSFDGGSIMFARLTGLKPSDKKMQGKYTELDTYDMTIETHPEIIPIEEYEKAGNQYRPLADVGSTQALTGIDLVSLYDQGNRRVSEVLDQLSDLTQEERQTYLNEFAQYMRDNNVNTQDKLEEALRKFICNL